MDGSDTRAHGTNTQLSHQWQLGATGSSLFQGNPAYACPEALRNGRTGKRYDLALADSYSVGATLFQLLTGELPVRAPREGAALAGASWSLRWDQRLLRWERCLLERVRSSSSLVSIL